MGNFALFSVPGISFKIASISKTEKKIASISLSFDIVGGHIIKSTFFYSIYNFVYLRFLLNKFL